MPTKHLDNPKEDSDDDGLIFNIEETDESGFPIVNASFPAFAVPQKFVTMEHHQKVSKDMTINKEVASSASTCPSSYGKKPCGTRNQLNEIFLSHPDLLRTWFIKLIFQLYVAPRIKRMASK